MTLHILASQEYPTEQQEGAVSLPNPRAEASRVANASAEPQSVLDLDVPMSMPANPDVAIPSDQQSADENPTVNPKSEPYESVNEERQFVEGFATSKARPPCFVRVP